MTHCAACSSPVPLDAGFCPACGAPQGSATNLPTIPQSGVHVPRLAGGERFLPGTVLEGRYRITGRLGRGGMGEVARADDLKLGQTVALKFLPEGLEGDPDRLQRLMLFPSGVNRALDFELVRGPRARRPARVSPSPGRSRI